MSKPLAIGIDLGTTYSAVAHLDQAGQPRTLSNAEGEMLTPSVLLFENDQVIVGKEALKAVATDADRVAQCIKRELGRRVFEKELGGRQYPPEALQGWVLNKLRRDASHVLGGFTQAVITVPAYFDEVRRKATQDAGYIAGLEVMDIINEPTAAAIAFGFRQGLFSESLASARPSRILVYDLGGGTFDVTVMEINGNKFIALATDGDVQLGGYDWDQRLVNLVADEFTRRFDTDPRADENTLGRLWRDCEDAKRTLSARPQVSVPCDYKGDSVRIEITRQQFEEATRDLVDRTAFTTRQTLQAAGLTWKEIDRVLLVGGSTRMPAIVELLRELSQLEPDASVSADEAVAHGAALHAGHLIAKHQGRVPPFTVQNVNSHSLGVVAMDPSTKRDRNAILIPRNTPLPVTAKRVFKTQSDGQKSVLVQIVEGESPSPEHCVQLGRCTVRGIPPDVPAQTPIEVRFQYEENGRLTIMVNITGANAWTQHQITRENSMTTEDLETWRHFVTRGSQPKSIQ